MNVRVVDEEKNIKFNLVCLQLDKIHWCPPKQDEFRGTMLKDPC